MTTPSANRTEKPSSERRTRYWAVLGLAACLSIIGFWWLLGAGQTGSPEPTEGGASGATRAASSSPANSTTPIVIAISIDGLNPEAITRLGEAKTPTFHRMMREGASTLNARTAYELTITLPNHTGMLTGRRIDGVDGHSVRVNKDKGATLATVHGEYVPSMMDVAHDHGLRTAFFAEKDKFHFLVRSWDPKNGAADRISEDNGRDKIDIAAIGPKKDVVAKTENVLRQNQADLIFLHLKAVDSVGHDHGWLGPDYLTAVESVDERLGELVDTITGDPALRERVTILLTADHGGPEGKKKHDDYELAANFRIGFIAWGAGVAAGTNLYGLNPERREPGDRRVDYTNIQPVRNIDIANTALGLLGLDPIDGAISTSWPALKLS